MVKWSPKNFNRVGKTETYIKMFKRKNKLKLGAMLLFVGNFAANAQYNVDYKMAEYLDPQTVESTVDVGDGEVVTVGTIKVTDGRQLHEDVILTRLDKSGKIIWNMRYGIKEAYERGNGITLSWDKKHVIVAGSFEKIIGIDIDRTRERYAMVLKVRISDGALIWTTLNGNDTDEQAFLVKRSNGRDLVRSYVVVGTSTGDREESYERMLAFKIDDGGTTSWSNRYYLGENFPYRSIRPTSMVSNADGTFMIAGTRAEINRPTRLFTVGIKSSNGAISHLFNYYETGNIYHVERCDITKDTYDRYDRGYALTFTAKDFRGDCLVVADDDLFYSKDKIGVIRMDASRRVLWSKIYYTKSADNQDGLSIFFYKDELQVCVNINDAVRYNTPGILRLKKENGNIISLNTYHIPSYRGDYGPLGNSMVRLGSNEYAVKSIYKDWGFSMVNPNVLSDAKCDREVRAYQCKFKVVLREQGVKPVEYARGFRYRLPYDKVGYGEYPCGGFGIVAPTTTEEENTGNFSSGVTEAVVYPSPVGENQDVVTLQFLAENAYDLGNVKIFNGQGQEMLTQDISIIDGQNNMEFSAQQFAPGMYMVLISGNGEILDRVKFIKN